MHVFVHIVWSTHHRLPLIVPSMREELYAYLGARAARLKCHVLALGGMPDHVHLAVRLHQAVSVSKLAQEMKGASSHQMSRVQHRVPERLVWQEGYGAFSFRENDLPVVVRYIRTQPERHACDEWVRDSMGVSRSEGDDDGASLARIHAGIALVTEWEPEQNAQTDHIHSREPVRTPPVETDG